VKHLNGLTFVSGGTHQYHGRRHVLHRVSRSTHTRQDMPFEMLVSREGLPTVGAKDHLDGVGSLPPERTREEPDVQYNVWKRG
jgi:hypothetical protein